MNKQKIELVLSIHMLGLACEQIINRPLMQDMIHALVARENDYIPDKYSCRLQNITMNTNFNNIHSFYCADAFKFQGLIIPLDCEKDDCIDLTVQINGFDAWLIPFKLLYVLSQIKTNNTSKIITFPERLFDNKYLRDSISNPHPKIHGYVHKRLITRNCLNYNVILTSNKSLKFELLLTYFYYPADIQNLITKQPLSCVINQYPKENFSGNRINSHQRLLSTGIFIETDKEINSIEIKFNNFTYLKYNANMIQFACDIISNYVWTDEHKKAFFECVSNILPLELIHMINSMATCTYFMYWLPFNSQIKWNDEDIGGAVNLNKCDMTIIFNEPMQGTIYYKCLNIFRYDDIYAAVRYSL